MCNVSFNPPRFAHRYGRENMFRLCTQLFQCHVFCCLSEDENNFSGSFMYANVSCHILCIISTHSRNKFFHYLQTRALHRPNQNVSACLFYLWPEAESNRKKLNFRVEKRESICRKEKHCDTQFSLIFYGAFIYSFHVSENYTKHLTS